MNIDFTRPSLFRSILYFLLLYAVFRYRDYLLIPPASAPEDLLMPLQHALAGFFSDHPVWRELTAFLFAFINAYYITRILSRNLIYLERTYIPAMIYPLVALGYCSAAMTPVTLIVSFLLIFALDNMIKAHKEEANFGHFLHASVALGAALLLYAPSALYLLLLPVGFALFRQNWRSILTSLLGYFLPLFFCSYVLWGMGHDFGETTRRIFSILTHVSGETLFIFRLGLWDYILCAVFLLLVVLALLNISRNRATMRRRAQRGNAIFIWTLLFTLFMVALPGRNLDILPLLAVPLSAIIPACFNRKTGWMPNLFYLLMIWTVLLYNLYLIFPDLW